MLVSDVESIGLIRRGQFKVESNR